MVILLTNDDGIQAQGIRELFKGLKNTYEVYVVAPYEEKSACSNAITVRENLIVTPFNEHEFAVHGYPADCVNIALHGEIIPPVDIVISGVNHGPNLGDDIYYSGTVGAARAAYVAGISALAVSLDSSKKVEYIKDIIFFLKNFLKNKIFQQVEKKYFFNINYPFVAKDKLKGIKYTHLGKKFYKNSFEVVNHWETHFSVQMGGSVHAEVIEGSDITEVKNGYISVTPLTLDSTDYRLLKKLHENE
jgi:5'-nucleotidase